MLRVGAAADHVAERPQLLGATRLGGAEHRLERFRMRMRIGKDRDDHDRNLVLAVADTLVDPER